MIIASYNIYLYIIIVSLHFADQHDPLKFLTKFIELIAYYQKMVVTMCPIIISSRTRLDSTHIHYIIIIIIIIIFMTI